MAFVRSQNLFIFALCAGLLSCGKTNFASKPNEEVFGQVYQYSSKVDILWVVDTSDSMAVHQNHISDQFGDFIDLLVKKKMDFHMALTTMDMGSGGEKGKFVGDTKVLSRNTANLKSKFSDLIRQGESGSSLERGIGAAAAALTEPLISSVNTGFLRLGSLLAIIFISNEDDHSSQSPEDLANLLDTIRPEGDFGRNWIVNYIGITEPDGYCRTSGNYSDPGDRYMDLVDFSNGVQENICEENLSPALSNLKKRIVSQLTQFKLKDNADEATIVVTNNGKKVKKNPENGWSYNSGKNAVAFHGSAIPSADDVIRIKYDILR